MYDVTNYLADHPGGAEVLAEAAGTDATEEFDNAGHSEDAWTVMESFCVGKLKGFEKKKPKPKPVVRQSRNPAHSSETTGQSRARLANLGIFSVSIAAIYYVGSRYGSPAPKWLWPIPNGGASEQRGFGFMKGLLMGAGVFAAVDALIAQRFARLVWSNKSFTSYPAHMKIPGPVQEDTLLQRGLLDPVTYSHLPLKTKVLLAPNVYKFTFNLPTTRTVLGLPIGQHVAIKANVGGESVSRSYTPVSNNSDRGVLELVVKVYPDGKLTNGYMANLNVGDEVLFRGPKGAMRYHRDLCKKIGMIAGGTGITPMFQVIRAICEDDRDTTEVSLIYANRTEQDILLRQELDTFARRYPKNFKAYYLLDQPPADWKFGKGYVTSDLMEEKLPGPSINTKMMLCGPPGMVNAARSSLVTLGFEQPGASSKITDQIFLF